MNNKHIDIQFRFSSGNDLETVRLLYSALLALWAIGRTKQKQAYLADCQINFLILPKFVCYVGCFI